MPKIPSTFCPAKWDDLHLNFNFNYAYGCCKATPIVFVDNWTDQLNKQKENLLNNIQDSSCNYCWKVENTGGSSDRIELLKRFDQSKIELYQTNQVKPTNIEVNLGNECNFQCTYCNPKFSSQWESDIKQQPYKFKTDIRHYGVSKKIANNMPANLDFLKTYDQINVLNLIGGEPLKNKRFFQLLAEVDNVDNLHITTNFSCNREMIDKIIEMSKKYKSLVVCISVDATGEIAEFTRYGMNYAVWLSNIEYLIANMTNNMKIIFQSLITTLTIVDLANTTALIEKLHSSGRDITWRLSYCVTPRIQSFATLENDVKLMYINLLTPFMNKVYVKNAAAIINAIQSAEFDPALRNELDYFVQEFSERKHLRIPKEYAKN